MRKPNPAIFHHALELLGGVEPGAAVFLDDAPGNVDGARRAGLQGILVDGSRRRPRSSSTRSSASAGATVSQAGAPPGAARGRPRPHRRRALLRRHLPGRPGRRRSGAAGAVPRRALLDRRAGPVAARPPATGLPRRVAGRGAGRPGPPRRLPAADDGPAVHGLGDLGLHHLPPGGDRARARLRGPPPPSPPRHAGRHRGGRGGPGAAHGPRRWPRDRGLRSGRGPHPRAARWRSPSTS